ncbi:hypothetical protein [Haloferula sp. BvORR071]|uniref:hypothetical protein n=1 Tax=Haloferula sp. BvORR071 TaxID=1396141 RepID=UPI002240F323|nr:hypothetical protein [Haloferula sp. BvORR071]
MKVARMILCCAVIAATPACTTLTTDTATTAKVEQGVPGGEYVQTTRLDATVTAIDYSKRQVGLVSKHGENFVVEADSGVANFNQIHVGDHLAVVLRETLLIRMAKPGEKLDEIAYVTGERARRGAKPGAKASGTSQYVATVTAIDAKRRKATLKFSDGSSGKFDIREDIDLTKHHTGERVLMRNTQTLAVSMTKS